MKSINSLIYVVAIVLISPISFATWIDMCIDPGHGGDSAAGTPTSIPDQNEKNLNLQFPIF